MRKRSRKHPRAQSVPRTCPPAPPHVLDPAVAAPLQGYAGDLEYLEDEAHRIELLLRMRRLEVEAEDALYRDKEQSGPERDASRRHDDTTQVVAIAPHTRQEIRGYIEDCRKLILRLESSTASGRASCGSSRPISRESPVAAGVTEVAALLDLERFLAKGGRERDWRPPDSLVPSNGSGYPHKGSSPGGKRKDRQESDPESGAVTAARSLVSAYQDLLEANRRIAARLQATHDAGRSLAMDRLVQGCGLSSLDRDILLVLAAPLLVPRLRRLLRDGPLETWRTIEVYKLIDILAPTVPASVAFRRHFSIDAPLVRHNLVGLVGHDQATESEFLDSGLELPRRVFNLMLGDHALDESLLGFTHLLRTEVPLDHVVLPDPVKEKILALVDAHPRSLQALRAWGLDRVVPYGRGVFLLFSGPPGTGKTLMAHALATHLRRPLLKVDLQRLNDRSRSTENAIRDVFREALLLDAILFFDECEFIFADRRHGNEKLTVLLTQMEQFEGIGILATNLPMLLDHAVDRRIRLKLNFPAPGVDQRERIWRVHLPERLPLAQDVDLRQLAEGFDLPGGYIKNAVLTAVQRALARDPVAPCVSQADLREAARQQVRDRLAGKVERRVPRIPLARLVLDSPVAEQVQAALWAARYQQEVFEQWGLERTVARGRAVTMLLAGPPGTGKSAVAEALAYELGQPLHVVSLAGILSAWHGETEKNLAAAFREAQEEQAVLVLEEADVLFTAREGEGVHTRREVAVLLEEMERFEGVLAATTNLPGTMDPAFERRFRYRLDFGPPGPEARLAIWKSHLPAELPLAEDVDLVPLAERYDLTGGQIRNALVLAATEAARRGQGTVGEADLEQACERTGEAGPGKRRLGFGSWARAE